jgi:ADP-dependent NAD(P)H-hydrate dehydratase / NAD(P)H-hydrate epimerase
LIVLVGTIPCETGVYAGPAEVVGDRLCIGASRFPIERGSAAMAAACAQVCRFYEMPGPVCIFGGDIADGRGTDLMFAEVNATLQSYQPDVVTLHYVFPKLRHGGPFLEKIASLSRRPQLIADAGAMYLFKTIHKASTFDVFTPDQGELLFLADELAPHPLYVRREFLGRVDEPDALVRMATRHGNAPKTIVAKGAVDYIYRNGTSVAECRAPLIPSMEAIGGTGDTVTGMLSALRFRNEADADLTALVLNRLIAQRIGCTPATQIGEFVAAIPDVLKDYEKGNR